MASIGPSWVDDTWVQVSWVTSAWGAVVAAVTKAIEVIYELVQAD